MLNMINIEYSITIDKTDYDRKLKLRELFLENGLNCDNIQFKNQSVRFNFNKDEWSICQMGPMGWGLFPNEFNPDENYELFQNKEGNANHSHNIKYNDIHYYTVPEILDMVVDLSSFYDDPLPSDFINSPRISSQYIASYFWNEIIKYNYINNNLVYTNDNDCELEDN